MLRRLNVRDESGFLLVELLAASMFIALIFGLCSALIVEFQRRDSTLMGQAVLATEARPTLDTMAAEIESAMCNGTGPTATQPITNATATSITFTAPDMKTPYTMRQYTYTLTSGSLNRQIVVGASSGGAWTFTGTPLLNQAVQQVTNATVFHYYDSTGTEIAAPVSAANLPNIAKVTMTLVIVPKATGGIGTLTTQQSATLRTPTCSS